MAIHEKVDDILSAARAACKNTHALSRLDNVQLHFSGYAEAGYDDPESGVIALGNWNDISRWKDGIYTTVDDTMPGVSQALDELGVAIEWEDEWTDCQACGKLVRTSPDCHGWQPSYYTLDDTLLCSSCAAPEEVLQDLEGCANRALTLDIDPTEYGYVRHGRDYEHGLHHGQDDDPEKIGASLLGMGITRYLFRLDGTGQFDMRFSVYVHESQADLLCRPAEGKCDISPATAMERALREGSAAADKLEGEGIRYVTCKPDGTADVRLVDREEFVNGIGAKASTDNTKEA